MYYTQEYLREIFPNLAAAVDSKLISEVPQPGDLTRLLEHLLNEKQTLKLTLDTAD